MSMERKMIRIVQENGQIIEREFNADELKQNALDSAALDQLKGEAEAKAAVRASALAKLAALGLSADEIAAL